MSRRAPFTRDFGKRREPTQEGEYVKSGKPPFSRQVIILLVVAGAIIVWDLFSGHGGMKSGMISVTVVALTMLLLGSMVMGGALHRASPPQEMPDSASPEDKTEDTIVALPHDEDRQSKAKLN